MFVGSDNRISKTIPPFALQALLHFGGDFGFFLGIGEALAKFLTATVERSFRDQLAYARAGSCVSILIMRDVQALGARLFNIRQHTPGLAPGGRPRKFDVRNRGTEVG